MAPRPLKGRIPRVVRDGMLDDVFSRDNRLGAFTVGLVLGAGIEVFVFTLGAFNELGLFMGTGTLLGFVAAVTGVALFTSDNERLVSLFLFL